MPAGEFRGHPVDISSYLTVVLFPPRVSLWLRFNYPDKPFFPSFLAQSVKQPVYLFAGVEQNFERSVRIILPTRASDGLFVNLPESLVTLLTSISIGSLAGIV